MMMGLHVAQAAACNRLHDIDRRLARWLLMAHDRVDSGTLRVTHDFLATMLGTDRPSVSLAAGLLQKMNIIKYSRGSVKILNRGALENRACECYAIIQRYALMSYPATGSNSSKGEHNRITSQGMSGSASMRPRR